MEREGSLQLGTIGRGLRRWTCGPSCLGVHVGVFLLVATALTLINVAVSPENLWFWRPLAWWGGLVAVHAALTLGGSLTREGEPESEAVERAVIPSPADAERRPRLATLLGRGAGDSPTVGPSTAHVGGSVLGVLRSRLEPRRPGPDPVAPAAPPLDEDPAFASWRAATDGWTARDRSGRPSVGWRGRLSQTLGDGLERVASLGERGAAAASGLAGRTHADGEMPPPPRPDGIARPLPPTSPYASAGPTGRFGGTPSAADAATHEPGRAREVGSTAASPPLAWVPGSVAGDREAPPSARADAGTWPVAPAGRLADAVPAPDSAPHAAPNGTAPKAGESVGRDVVLNGPVPIDPKDPQWAWLEAAAAAWLARRESDVANGHVRPDPNGSAGGPVEPGLNGAAPGHG